MLDHVCEVCGRIHVPEPCCHGCSCHGLTFQQRIDRLGRVLGFMPGSTGFDLHRSHIGGKRHWWLVGGVEGDQPLPFTDNAKTLREALEDAEAWFAPEIDCGVTRTVPQGAER